MKLWILRHGEAEPRKTSDPERALTAAGHKEAHIAGLSIAKYAGAGLVVLASPYRRAQQTAEAVLQELNRSVATLETVSWCTPEDDPIAALSHLSLREETELLLVSHMPFVSALAGLLVEGDTCEGPPMRTASLVELDVPSVAAGAARLLSVRHPPQW